MNWPQTIPGFDPGGALGVDFGDVAAESRAALEGTVISPLLHLGAIAATGPDTVPFLQGQLSNDVRVVSPTRAQLTSYNSPKGRMLAVAHLFQYGDAMLLELERSILDATLKRLKMFVLRAKTTLADATDRHPALGLAGPDAPALLETAGLPVPRDLLECATSNGILVLRRQDAGNLARYSVHAAGEQLDRLWDVWSGTARPVGTAAWRLLDINAGLPSVHPQTSDRFVAQMCNLDALGGISFDKGCYTGQEVIARVHYRGAVKRTMKAVRLDAPPPDPGTRLDDGEVVVASPHPAGGSLALVVGAAPSSY